MMWQEHQPVHGMYLQLRVWTYGLFMDACLCCSSLLIEASNPITNPEEGHFALVCCSFAFHDSQASFAKLSAQEDACLDFSHACFLKRLLMFASPKLGVVSMAYS